MDTTAQILVRDLGTRAAAIAYAERIATRAALNGNAAMAQEYEQAAAEIRQHEAIRIECERPVPFGC